MKDKGDQGKDGKGKSKKGKDGKGKGDERKGDKPAQPAAGVGKGTAKAGS